MTNKTKTSPAGRDRRIGIVGAGVMGRGIAQLFLQAGYPVRLYDTQAAALDGAAEFVGKMIGRQVEKGRHTQDEADTMLARLTLCRGMDGLASCRVVIEAVVVLLDVKKQLFA